MLSTTSTTFHPCSVAQWQTGVTKVQATLGLTESTALHSPSRKRETARTDTEHTVTHAVRDSLTRARQHSAQHKRAKGDTAHVWAQASLSCAWLWQSSPAFAPSFLVVRAATPGTGTRRVWAPCSTSGQSSTTLTRPTSLTVSVPMVQQPTFSSSVSSSLRTARRQIEGYS